MWRRDQGVSRWVPVAEGVVLIEASERRVPQGLISAEEFDLGGAITVEGNSTEHLNAGAPFDPSIEPGSSVPADCFWSAFHTLAP